MKTPLAQTYRRSPVGGRYYSRAPTDTNPPTAPVLFDPAPGTTTISVDWVNGVDAETGIRDSLVEIRPNGGTTWTQVIVPYIAGSPGSSAYQFTGLAQGMPYDIRVSNRDNAATPNVSSYSVIKTVSTLGTAPNLEPGKVSLAVTSYAVAEGGTITIGVTRTGAGSLSPAIDAQWAFSGFSEGAPSPANGPLHWGAGDNSTQFIQASAGLVTADRTGLLKIVSVTAETGTLNPSIGTAQASVTISNTSTNAQIVINSNWEDGNVLPAGFNTSSAGSHILRSINTNTPYEGTKCLRSSVVRSTTSDYRCEIASTWTTNTYTTAAYGVALRIDPSTTYPKQAVIFQFHQSSIPDSVIGTQNAPVPFAFFVQADGNGVPQWGFWTVWHEDIYAGTGFPNKHLDRYHPLNDTTYVSALGSLVLGQWYHWKVEITWDPRKSLGAACTGRLRIWKNGVLIIDRNNYPIGNGNIHNAAGAPKTSPNIDQLNNYNWKNGIYMYSGEALQPSNQQTFVIDHDKLLVAVGTNPNLLVGP